MRTLPLLALLLQGCCLEPLWYRRPEAPENPFPLRKIAVAPVLNLTPEPRDPWADADALATELSHFKGVEVVWPRQWNPPLPGREIQLQPLLEAARLAGADAVLVTLLNQHSPYPPPRLAMTMVLYPVPVSSRPALSVPYEDLMEAGKPFQAQLPRDPWAGAVSTRLDARDNGVRDRLHAWGLERQQSQASFDWKRGLYSNEEFRSFAMNETIRRLFERGPPSWMKPAKSPNSLE